MNDSNGQFTSGGAGSGGGERVALRHNQECTSNFGAMQYDSKCTRCTKIRAVIFLRRKNTRNGCSQQESTLALVKATQIIETYKLTKGEVFDREYDSVMREVIQKNQTQYAKRPKRTKMSQYSKLYDESQLQ